MKSSTKGFLLGATAGIALLVGGVALVGAFSHSRAHESGWGYMQGYDHPGGYGRHGMMRGGPMMGGPMMGGGAMMGGPRAMLERFDSDGDGKVTAEELESHRQARFSAFDKDGNGQLDNAEFTAMWTDRARPRIMHRFQHLDGDFDGAVSAEEFRRPLGMMMDRLDRDGDGAIDRSDFRRHRHGYWHDRSEERDDDDDDN